MSIGTIVVDFCEFDLLRKIVFTILDSCVKYVTKSYHSAKIFDFLENLINFSLKLLPYHEKNVLDLFHFHSFYVWFFFIAELHFALIVAK